MKLPVLVTSIFFCLFLSSSLGAQEKPLEIHNPDENINSSVRIRMASGATFQGILYEVNDQIIILIDKNGQLISLLKEQIEAIQLMDSDMDKKAYFQDSASNRLLIMPTGFPMETGEFHISDQEIAAVTMSYGMNENTSFWGGISIPGALVSARYTFQTGDRSALSLGSFAGVSWIEIMGLLLPYAVYSVGSPDRNFTLGTGVALGYDEEGIDTDGAVLAIGGKWPISDTTAVVTENWIVWGRMPDYINPYLDAYGDTDYERTNYKWDPLPLAIVPGIAFRIANEKFSWDIGAVLPILIFKEEGEYTVEGLGGENSFIPIPLLSFTYRID